MAKGPILIVEDEAIMREALSEWLKDDGYHVEAAEDGEKALKLIEGKKYSLVILDLKMPGVDGLTVLKEAKAKFPKINVVMITAYPTVQTAVESMKIGAAEYLTKPFTPEELENVIERILGPSIKEKKFTVEPTKADIDNFDSHLANAKNCLKSGKLEESLNEILAATSIDPDHFEARYTLMRVQKAVDDSKARGEKKAPAAAKKVEAAATEVIPKECVWMKAKVVAYRLCYTNYQCASCDFSQMMQEQRASLKDDAAASKILSALKSQPAGERKCRYMLSGNVAFRTCNKLYECLRCEYDQLIQDNILKK